MNSVHEGTFRIGRCTVDPALDEVSRDGVTVKIEPRAMRMLAYLAARAGEVVGVEELLDHVWAGLVVTPDSVYTAIGVLRRALGDDAREPRYIANVPRRGYRLIAAVEPATLHPAPTPASDADAAAPDTIAAPLAPTPPRRRAWWWLVPVALAVPAGVLLWRSGSSRHEVPVPVASPVFEKSIAVLPFVDMSENHDQEYFSDGLSEELIDMLAQVPGLRVPARTSSFYFKGKQAKLPEISRELGVAHVLEGSVRKVGNRLRVTAQLVRTDTGYHLWSKTYDRQLDDIFAIQDDIAAAVVTELKAQLARGASSSRGRGTASPEAYDAYLLGRQFHLQNTVPGWSHAIDAYRKAIEVDARYADAHADLAMAQYFLAANTGDAALEDQAEQSAQTAIDLDPRLAAGYSSRGALRYLRRYDWTGGESDLKQAVALDPADGQALARYGILLSYVGRRQEAATVLRQAIELDPLQNTYWQDLGITLAESGDYAQARDAFQHALVIRPTDSFSRFHLGRVQLMEGKTLEALTTFKENEDEEFRLAGLAMAGHTQGDETVARQALEKLIAVGAHDASYQIAEVYAWRGEKDRAFEWLQRAYRDRDGGLVDLKGDFQLADLRSDPRYRKLLRELNLPP